jgi:hypothetical protein
VLVPTDRVRLEHKGKKVVVDGVFARDLADYPVYSGLPLAKGMEDQIQRRFHSPAPSPEGWSDRAARRFFGGVRRRGGSEDEVDATSAPPANDSTTVVHPVEGEEVRIRVSNGDIIIEKHNGGSDHG